MTDAALRAVNPSNRLPRRRSIMTNDPRRLDGIDMRTSAGRRYRDIVDALAIEFGVAVNPVALRELAGLRYTLEQTLPKGIHRSTVSPGRGSTAIGRSASALPERGARWAGAFGNISATGRRSRWRRARTL
jgi:hypothetical protein